MEPAKFIAYGLNHVTAPISVREKYALPPEGVAEVLARLRPHAPETVFLSTCNRVEFYLNTPHPERCLEEVREALSHYHKLKPAEAKKFFYHHEGTEGFLHLFRVAASLDSMVVGEAQILGQVKEAFQGAQEAGTVGSAFHGIFERAFAAAKRVRTQTDIARSPVNVSSVSVDLARKIFADLREKSALLVGAGEMGELTAKYLVDAGMEHLFIGNRTLDKAKALAARLGGEALGLEGALGHLENVDIVLVSLSTMPGWLQKGAVESAMRARKGRPLFLIDLGVPRNIDPEAGKLDSVYLYNIDDLSRIAESNRAQRRKAVEDAEVILREEVSDLAQWLSSLELVPVVVRLREHFEAIRKAELDDFFRKNAQLTEKERRSLERLSRDLTQRLLHEPSVNLKQVKDPSDRYGFARMLEEVFLRSKGRE
ncbi:MAG TPA: glutamyl-tRNA reductase [bacterium]|nr:glutamyl-tRNA reductase [bacterium]